jgi:putative Mn2+ efflux pump MntP
MPRLFQHVVSACALAVGVDLCFCSAAVFCSAVVTFFCCCFAAAVGDWPCASFGVFFCLFTVSLCQVLVFILALDYLYLLVSGMPKEAIS